MSEFDDPVVLRNVIESLQTGVYLVGKDGKILFWSDGAQRILGHRRQDILGRVERDDLFAQGEGNQTALADALGALAAVFRDGRPVTTDASLRHKDGHRIRVILRAVPVRNGEGAIIGAAESFDEPLSSSAWERRRTKLAGYHCLDEVTGVPNHAITQAHLRENLAIFAEYRIPVSVLAIQIDQLEHFRTTYGPGALGAIFRAVAQTLDTNLRPTDFLGRYSELYFLAILPECGEADVGKVAERMKKMVTYAEVKWWGDDLSVTASFGGAASRTGDTVESLVERAEKSLADSIAAGGNRFELCTE
jgi:diguanylate cyclase (GGDEF)-like protein/PAS domain S-box-containing protein